MESRLCTSNFVINNLPAEQRQFLSRKSVQDAICKFADVKIYTRGHYIKPRHDGFVDSRPQLSLHIVGANKRNISLANQKIHSLLMNPEDFEEEEMSDTEKITIGIDVFPLIFGMKTKILGENNENAEYILNETGAVMTLRGKGSGFIDLRDKRESEEPLHVHVRYKNMDNREKTRELILNLIDTVQQDFISSSYGKFYSPPKKPEIIPVPVDRIRRTSSYNSLSSRSPVRNIERSIDRRSAEKRGIDSRIPPEPRPFDSRAPESRPFDSRPSLETRPFEDRTPEPRPFESRATEPRVFENRLPERPFEGRTPESKPYDSRPTEPRPAESHNPESDLFEDLSPESTPFDSRVPEPNPFEDRSSEPRRTRESRFEGRPAESRPFENRSDRRSVENPLPDSTKSSPGETTSSNIEKITIGIESVPPAFNLKSKIYGPNLANVKHIEKVASALLLVEGKGCGANSTGEEAQEPPYILVKYLKPELKEVARGLIFNLIETIQQEYITLYGRYPGGPQKPQIVPIKKLISEKAAADSTKIKRPPLDVTPVPPPPPVISKNSSPPARFDGVPPPVNFGIPNSKPLSPKLFANAEPTPVPRPVQPVMPSTTNNSFDPSIFHRLPEPESSSLPAPLSSIVSQSSILNSVLSSQPRLLQPGSFVTSGTSPAQIQTIQYSEKRPKSPVESAATDAKRFCSAGVGTYNSTIPSSVPAPVQPRAATAATSAKSKNPFRSNLIPINVNKSAGVAPNKNTPNKTPPLKPVPPPAPVPAPNISQLTANKKLQPQGILKKPQWNDIRNGSNREKSDSEDEGRLSNNPIILSDSEDEELTTRRNNVRISAPISKHGARDISVQTDDKLYQTQIKNIKCACGRFMHVVTGVRSVETQTIGGDSFRRF